MSVIGFPNTYPLDSYLSVGYWTTGTRMTFLLSSHESWLNLFLYLVTRGGRWITHRATTGSTTRSRKKINNTNTYNNENALETTEEAITNRVWANIGKRINNTLVNGRLVWHLIHTLYIYILMKYSVTWRLWAWESSLPGLSKFTWCRLQPDGKPFTALHKEDFSLPLPSSSKLSLWTISFSPQRDMQVALSRHSSRTTTAKQKR